MNKDRLFAAAFDGEPTGRLTPAEQAELQDLSRLKDDLRALREVPECQVSVDHLRRAILERGLPKERTRRRFVPWLVLGPVAAAAFGLFALIKADPANRPEASSPGQVALNDEAPQVSAASGTLRPAEPETMAMERVSSAPGVASVPEPATPETSRPQAVKREAPAKTRRAVHRNRPEPTGQAEPATGMLAFAGPRDAELDSLTMKYDFTGEARKAVVPEEKPSADESVVIVTTTPNPATGARVATEVSHGQDLLGGY
ncbi:MAG: hypothetical protein KIT11_00080 [Fimbriimonadaceae bacterium]|nr:hypothetical protein [Fimbriimonadaceae bacterium]QYK55228.1 MAG: hypothetical protein KF733_09455 [Fimbriimonadaceae bacterium]